MPLPPPAPAPTDSAQAPRPLPVCLLRIDAAADDDAALLRLARALESATGRRPELRDATASAPPSSDEHPRAYMLVAEPRRLRAWLAQHTQQGPWRAGPLSLFGSAPSAEDAAALVAAGLSGCWPLALVDDDGWLPAALALDQARWEAAEQLRRAAREAQLQLDERKWIDRAKGLLMSSSGMDERQAFELLRGAAMHASLRLAELSRAVLESAQWAETLNRAGQLRMLSQRLVSLAAQSCETPPPRRAATERTQALKRIDEILAFLRERSTLAAPAAPWLPLLERTAAGAAALRSVLASRWAAPQLPTIDSRAAAMLASAEELLAALEAASGRRALHIVNLCGRQRMRAQRVAKLALLAQLVPDAQRDAGLATVLAEFEAASLELEQAPLSTPEIRAMLAESREEWTRLLRGLRAIDTPRGRQALVRASDGLLDLFDRLTAAYERSLQVLLA